MAINKFYIFLSISVILLICGCGLFNSASIVVNADNANGWAVGDSSGGYGTILHTTDGGSNWIRQGSTSEVADVSLVSVCAIDNNNAWILGDIESGYPTVLKTSDGGSTWTRKSSATYLTNNELLKISALDNNNAWAVGMNGTILKTTDGGNTWTQQGTLEVPNVQLQAVYALNARTVWVGGAPDNGYTTIFKTTDGGASWVRQGSSSFEVTDKNLIDIYAVDENTAWAVGGVSLILKTTDGGRTWTNQSTTIPGDSNGIVAFDANNAWIAKDYGIIIYTTDGGTNWNMCPSVGKGGYFLLCPRAIDRNTIWIAGRSAFGINLGTILRTTDRGVSWEAQTTPVDIGFSGLSFVGHR